MRKGGFSFAFLLFLALALVFIASFRSDAAEAETRDAYSSQAVSGPLILQSAENEHTSSGPALTIIRDGFWHITYDENDTASCKFYRMPICSPRGATFTYARDQWVCEPYETRTLWYFVGDDEYLVEGWQKIDGVWYYFEERTGRMYADEMTPDGHYMGPDGALAD